MFHTVDFEQEKVMLISRNYFKDEQGHVLEHPQRVSASFKAWHETRIYVYDNSQFYTSIEQHRQFYNKMNVLDWEI